MSVTNHTCTFITYLHPPPAPKNALNTAEPCP